MKEPDPIREFLRERGASDVVVHAGVAGLVAGWERVARDVTRGYPFGLDEWLNDLDGRQLLAELTAALPGALASHAVARLEAADRDVRAHTLPSHECVWGDDAARREHWTAEANWWYFRLPRELV